MDKQLYPYSGVKDLCTNGVISTEGQQHDIHLGKNFVFYDSVNMTNGQVVDYLIVTPQKSVGYVHYTRSIDFTADTTVQIYEATNKNGVTSMASQVSNKNRNALDTDSATIFKGLTGGTTDGTLRTSYRSGGGVGSNRFGGTNRTVDERVLKPNTKYIIRVTNNSTGSNLMNIGIDWSIVSHSYI